MPASGCITPPVSAPRHSLDGGPHAGSEGQEGNTTATCSHYQPASLLTHTLDVTDTNSRGLGGVDTASFADLADVSFYRIWVTLPNLSLSQFLSSQSREVKKEMFKVSKTTLQSYHLRSVADSLLQHLMYP